MFALILYTNICSLSSIFFVRNPSAKGFPTIFLKFLYRKVFFGGGLTRFYLFFASYTSDPFTFLTAKAVSESYRKSENCQSTGYVSRKLKI